MAEANTNFTLDELLGYAGEQVTDLERLGLSGLPDTLAGYGITDQSEVASVAQKIARVAYRELSLRLHPDVASDRDSQADTHFKTVEEAMQRINNNPQGALQELILHQDPDSELRKNLRRLNVAKSLENRIRAQRELVVATLFNMPYYRLFDIGPDEELALNISAYSLNVLPDGATRILEGTEEEIEYLETADDEEALSKLDSMHQVPASIDVEVTVKGDSARLTGVKFAPLENGVDQAVVDAHTRRYKTYIDQTARLMTRTLVEARFIGAFKPIKNEEYEQPHTAEVYLEAGDKDRSPLSSINGAPGSMEAIDRLGPRIPKQTRQNIGYVLLMARRQKNGNFGVGILGNYNVLED